MPRLSPAEINQAAALLGKLGGLVRSKKKTKANRRNAQKPRPNRRKNIS